MKIYIAGKMRGIKDFNKYAFYDAEAKLRYQGFDVLNPVRLDEKNGISLISETGDTADIEGFNGLTLDAIILEDVAAILQCDGIYLLKGWETSKGATAEKAIAEWKGLDIMYE
jgi:hypothetical protein